MLVAERQLIRLLLKALPLVNQADSQLVIGCRNQSNIAYKLLQIYIAAFRTVDVTDQSNLTCGLYLLQTCTHFNGLTGLKRNGLRRNLVRHGLALTLCIWLGEIVLGGNGRIETADNRDVEGCGSRNRSTDRVGGSRRNRVALGKVKCLAGQRLLLVCGIGQTGVASENQLGLFLGIALDRLDTQIVHANVSLLRNRVTAQPCVQLLFSRRDDFLDLLNTCSLQLVFQCRIMLHLSRCCVIVPAELARIIIIAFGQQNGLMSALLGQLYDIAIRNLDRRQAICTYLGLGQVNGRVVLRALACADKLLAFKEFDFLLLISDKRS